MKIGRRIVAARNSGRAFSTAIPAAPGGRNGPASLSAPPAASTFPKGIRRRWQSHASALPLPATAGTTSRKQRQEYSTCAPMPAVRRRSVSWSMSERGARTQDQLDLNSC